MNDDDRRLMVAWVTFVVAVCAVAITLVVAVIAPARAATQVDIDGQPHLVLDPDDQRRLLLLLNNKDAEIAVLRGELAKVKKGCPQT